MEDDSSGAESLAVKDFQTSNPAMTVTVADLGQGRSVKVIRVARFGVHAPSGRKIAALEDAFRRQTLAYGRAMRAVYPDAVERLRLAARIARENDTARRKALLTRDRSLEAAIVRAAIQAAGKATSSVMAAGLGGQVKGTVQSWIGWRLRFREERPRRIERARERLAEVEADPVAAVAALQARRRRVPITAEHVLTSARARLERERRRPPPRYPEAPRLTAPSVLVEALDALAVAAGKPAEDAARDRMNAAPRVGRTPLAWAGALSGQGVKRAGGRRDVKSAVALVRGDDGRIGAYLPLILPGDAQRTSRPENRRPCRVLGVPEPTTLTRSGLHVVLSYSRHAWQYLDGWEPRTAKLVWRERGRYELHVAFARDVALRPDPVHWLGLDRGVEHLAVVTDEQGHAPLLSGNPLAPLERRKRQAREALQQRGRAVRNARHAYTATAQCEVNRIAKEIAAATVRRGARLAVEDLRGFARGDSRALARAQYAALLQAIERRLELAGCPPLRRDGARTWQVRAAGTSATCAACGHQDAASRPARERFQCTGCGHTDHADVNAARNIARRGRETHEIARRRKASGGGGEGVPAAAGMVAVAPAPAEAEVP